MKSLEQMIRRGMHGSELGQLLLRRFVRIDLFGDARELRLVFVQVIHPYLQQVIERDDYFNLSNLTWSESLQLSGAASPPSPVALQAWMVNPWVG